VGRLEGRVSLVTGAGSGLGAAMAARFGAEGAAVVCTDVAGDTAQLVAESIEGAGGRAVGLAVDVTSSADLDRAVAATIERFGALDICVANAGIAGTGSATTVSDETWQAVLDTNLTGAWRTARAAIPHMVRRGRGSVIMQASIGGLIGVPQLAAYAAAKAGVIGLTRQMALDYAPDGVRVNALAPGTVPTPLVRQTAAERGEPADVATAGSAQFPLYPLGRLGTPEDVASAAVYLASDDSAWVTGTVLVVDGGRTAG
jgi:NAD(P)-dependent dehydrogenase (short-subunit alcohol dehydrogenase family)